MTVRHTSLRHFQETYHEHTYILASAPEALPEKPGGRHTGLIIAAIIIVLAIMASIIFAVAKNTGRDSAADGKTTVKIGTTEAANDYWNVIKKKAAAEGINIDVVSFNDYTQPNVALSQGQIDSTPSSTCSSWLITTSKITTTSPR